jgi:PIN domain nuclease of toxin-antitoxin system
VILLDTHVLVWMTMTPERLSKPAKEAIQSTGPGSIFISDITLWEIVNLLRRGKVQIGGAVDSFLQDIVLPVSIRPITPAIASMTAEFPSSYPKDPADRIIGATSRVEGLPLVTADRGLRRSKLLQTIW